MSADAVKVREGVFMAYSDDVLVLLDLERDRYCAMTRRASLELRPWLEGECRAAPMQAAAYFAAAGVTSEGCGGKPAALHRSRPVLAQAPIGRASALVRLRAGLARARAGRAFKRRHINSIVAARRAWRDRCRTGANPGLALEAAGRFAATRPGAGAHDACLREALALLGFMGRSGACADWVFAVKASPFSAHCWVQLGDVVLNDSIEAVRPYTPIMVA